MTLGPDIASPELLRAPISVFYNEDREEKEREKEKETQKVRKRAQLLQHYKPDAQLLGAPRRHHQQVPSLWETGTLEDKPAGDTGAL